MQIEKSLRRNRPTGYRPTLKKQELLLKEYAMKLGHSINSQEFQESMMMVALGKIEVNKINGQIEVRFV